MSKFMKVSKHDEEYGELYYLVTQTYMPELTLQCSIFRTKPNIFCCSISSIKKERVYKEMPFVIEQCSCEEVLTRDAIAFLNRRTESKIIDMKIKTKDGRFIVFNEDKYLRDENKPTLEDLKILHQYYRKFLDYGLFDETVEEEYVKKKGVAEKTFAEPTFANRF